MLDDVLLAAARAGDPAALAELMRVHRAQVVRYAMRLCVSPEDAEDATQEALLALSRYVGALREAAALSRWLFLAVRTHCVRLARRSLRHALSLDDGAPVALEGPTPEEQLVDRQLRDRISVILSGMSPAFREVIVRRDILGESNEDVAVALGLTVEATKSRLHRARQQVKEELLASIDGGRKKKSRLASIV